MSLLRKRGAGHWKWVKKGTQIIDGIWKLIKTHGVPKTVIADENFINRRVRDWQWRYWNTEGDKWIAMDEVIGETMQGDV